MVSTIFRSSSLSVRVTWLTSSAPLPLAPATTPCPSRGRWWPPWSGDQASSPGPRFGAGYRGRGGSGRRENDTPEASRRTRRPQTSAELQRNEHATSCEGPERGSFRHSLFTTYVLSCRRQLGAPCVTVPCYSSGFSRDVRPREAFRGVGSPQRAHPGSSSALPMEVA